MMEKIDKFKIGKVIESKKDVFNCESLSERMEEFAEIRDARYERFFITNKSPYLFFDEEEQQYLSKTSFSLNLNCSLEIYIKDISGPMVKKEIDELSLKTQRFVVAELKKLKAREVMTIGEAIALRRAARQDKSVKAKEDEMTMETFFGKYGKLVSITTVDQFNRYRKFLLKKYHPDISKEKFAAEKEAEYREAFANPYNAARYGYIDDVIEPRNTRFRIIRALQQLTTKKLTNPPKKHDNLPL